MTPAHAFAQVFRRDLAVAVQERSDVALTLLFFLLVVGLFPLGVGADPKLLQRIAPGVFWVAALLAALLSLGRIAAQDHLDGTLEQLLLAPAAGPALAAGKIVAHWATTGLPLCLLSPVLALQFDLGARETGVLMLSLLLGSPTLSLLGGVCAALTLNARGGGTLLALLTLPLFVPVLIFGAGAVAAAQAGVPAEGSLSLLAALLLASMVGCPLAMSVAMAISVE
jgi:heme exporter protein B